MLGNYSWTLHRISYCKMTQFFYIAKFCLYINYIEYHIVKWLILLHCEILLLYCIEYHIVNLVKHLVQEKAGQASFNTTRNKKYIYSLFLAEANP